MTKKKIKLKLDDFECNLLINGMNEFRNILLAENLPTEDVDELLLKIIDKSEKYHGLGIFLSPCRLEYSRTLE